MRASLAIICIATAFLLSCGGSDSSTAVPRRYAYPRTAVLDTARALYTPAPGLSLSLSATAQPDSTRPGWLTARYAPLGATLYLSATALDAGERDRAIANRHQRIALNLGGATARTDTYSTDAGFSCEAVVAYDGTVTPVQFIALDDKMLINGAFALDNRIAEPDSLRPVIEALEQEAFEITRSLTH